MKFQHHLAALLFATTMFAACKKEDQEKKKEELNTGTVCRLSKAYLYGNANDTGIIHTLVYTYTDTNITKLTTTEGYYKTFEYSGGRITRCNYFDSLTATALSSFDTVRYNSDGTISAIDWYGKGDVELDESYHFLYNAGKLEKLTYTSYWEGAESGYKKTHFYTYAGGNITSDSVVITYPDRMGHSSVYHYTHNTQANPFSKGGTNALFHSPFIMYYGMDALPFLVSANKVTGYGEDPSSETADFSYVTDAKGNVTTFKISGIPDLGWEYQCP